MPTSSTISSGAKSATAFSDAEPVGGGPDLVADELERGRDQLAERALVVDHEDPGRVRRAIMGECLTAIAVVSQSTKL